MRAVRITPEELGFLLRLLPLILQTSGVESQPFYQDLRAIVKAAARLDARWDKTTPLGMLILTASQWRLLCDLLVETAAEMNVLNQQEGEILRDIDYRALYVNIQCHFLRV